MSELLGADGVARCSWGNSTPDYAEYQTKTDRQIPVFVLTPVS